MTPPPLPATELVVPLPGDTLPEPKQAPAAPAAKPVGPSVADRFAADTATHSMIVLRDSGLYRHLRFKAPGTSMYYFDLITWPGALVVHGDCGTYQFNRIEDMFEFFRFFRGGPVNEPYWSEKTPGGRRSCKSYSEESTKRHVAEYLAESEEDWPGVTAAWNERLEGACPEYDLTYEGTAREALESFAFPETVKAGERQFRFSDTWEWDLSEYDWWFTWCCHAILHGIREYDAAVTATGWDGHTLALYARDMEITADVICPHAGKDLSDVPFEQQPRCRTEPREPGVPWPDCQVAQGWHDVGHDALDVAERYDIRDLPIRITWRWAAEDGLYVAPLPVEQKASA
jgi:hypothetical protein